MASNINPNNVDGNYPVAGQDNDSQGFRDNFTNLKTNLTFAKSEIDDLQSKAIVKSALTGVSLDNDMDENVIYRAQMQAHGETFLDMGTVSGVVTVSFLDGNFQKMTGDTITPSITLGLADFPTSGIAGSLRLWVNTTISSYSLVLPTSVTLGLSNLEDYDSGSKTITLTGAGDRLYEFITVDGGTNYWIIKLA
jgi:hypothetical protein